MAKFDFKKVLKVVVNVILADGYSDVINQMHIKMFEDQFTYEYPEFGIFKTEDQIRKFVHDEIEHKYPLKAFPYRKIGLIDLYIRDENNHEDLKFMASMNGEL